MSEFFPRRLANVRSFLVLLCLPLLIYADETNEQIRGRIAGVSRMLSDANTPEAMGPIISELGRLADEPLVAQDESLRTELIRVLNNSYDKRFVRNYSHIPRVLEVYAKVIRVTDSDAIERVKQSLKPPVRGATHALHKQGALAALEGLKRQASGTQQAEFLQPILGLATDGDPWTRLAAFKVLLKTGHCHSGECIEAINREAHIIVTAEFPPSARNYRSLGPQDTQKLQQEYIELYRKHPLILAQLGPQVAAYLKSDQPISEAAFDRLFGPFACGVRDENPRSRSSNITRMAEGHRTFCARLLEAYSTMAPPP